MGIIIASAGIFNVIAAVVTAGSVSGWLTVSGFIVGAAEFAAGAYIDCHSYTV